MLNTGKVLLAGGGASGIHVDCDLYDPSTDKFTPTGSLNIGREFATGTLLPNGTVLVTGGETGFDGTGGGFTSSAELYNPSTGSWTFTTGAMTTARLFHQATLLQNGKLLITGGTSNSAASSAAVASAEIYDPSTRTFSLTGSMNVPRFFHSAVLLPSRVLINP